MPDKKKRSVWRSAGLTVMLLMVCALLSVATINLVVIPFLNSANQPKVMTGSVPQVAQATATVDFDKGPPPPPTATGEFVRRPTPDVTQAKTLPTSVVPADVPTLEPEPTEEGVVSTPEPLAVISPSGERSTYTDTKHAFSFDYPSNWYLNSVEQLDSNGFQKVNVQIWNYDASDKTEISSTQLRIEIRVLPLPFQNDTSTEWIEQYQKDFAKMGIVFSDVKKQNVGSIEGIRWIATNYPAAPEPTIELFLFHEDSFYRINAFPAASEYLEIFEQVLATFKIR